MGIALKKGNNMNKKLISLIAGAAIVAVATGCSQTATSSVAGTSSEASSTATEELSGTLSMNGDITTKVTIAAIIRPHSGKISTINGINHILETIIIATISDE